MTEPSIGNVEPPTAGKEKEKEREAESAVEPAAPFSWTNPHPIFVILFVGAERQPFGIQKDLLCHHSSFYRNHFATNKQDEAVELTVELLDVKPDIFGLAQLFFYTHKVSPSEDDLPSYEQLVKLWELGYKLGVQGLGDAVIHTMIRCRKQTGRIPSTPLLIEVWNNTPEGSDIRTLLVTWAAEYMHASDTRAEFAKSLPQEVLSELVVMMSSLPAPVAETPAVQAGSGTLLRKNVHYLEDAGDDDDSGRKQRRVAMMAGGAGGVSGASGIDARNALNKKLARTSLQRPQKRRSSAAYLDPASITPAQKLEFCADLLTRMLSGPGFWTRLVGPFRDPVDPAAAPDYRDKVAHPMDLSTMKGKMDRGEYSTHDEFLADMRRIFTNCYTYNSGGGPLYEAGQRLEKTFEDKFAGMNKWIAKMAGDEGE